MKYSLKELSDILNISTTSVVELKRKLGMKRVENDELLQLKDVVYEIETTMGGAVTTNTICRFFNRELQFEEESTYYKRLYEEVLKDNEILAKDCEQLRRKCYGLETTIRNLEYKLVKRYEEF